MKSPFPMRGVLIVLGVTVACVTLLVSHKTGGRVELGDRHSGIKPLKEAKEGTGFAKSWDGWLKQVSLQVHAAVDLARGLPAAKKERLDGILGNDVAQDMKRGEAVAAGLKQRYGSAAARRKAAVQAATRPQAVSKKTGGAPDEEVERAAPKVSEAQIKKPVAQEGKSAIDPYGKELGNKVSHDDSVVEADERNVKMAEKKLESEEQMNIGMPSAAAKQPRRGRHVQKPEMPATSATHAYAKEASAHTDFEKGKKLLSAIDKKKASDKLRAMQGDIKMVLQSTPGDKRKAAKEAKQEESEFSAELDKLGLGGTAKAHHTAQHWPSQLELPGQVKKIKAH